MSNQQPFIGGLIAGKVAGKVIDGIVDRLVAHKNIPVTRRDAPKVREVVTQEVKEYTENATNNEPWYRSRVLIGGFGALMVQTGNIVVMLTDDVPNSMEDYWGQIAVMVPILFAIYGRLATRKPLGR